MPMSGYLEEIAKMQAPFYKNWIIARRNFFTVFEVVFWPFISLFSIGLLTRFLALEPEKVSFLLAGVIAFSILQVCQIDVAYVMLFDLWSKSIKHTFISPVSGYHLVLGSLLFGVIRGTVVFLILAGISYRLFDFNFLQGGVLAVAVFLTGIYLTSASIGMLVCISLLIFGQRAEVAAWSISGILMFICGIYYPVEVLPPLVQIISRAIPLTYFLEYFRSFYGFPATSLKTGFFLAIFYFALGLLLLEKTVKHARKSGLLLRLSE